MPTFTTNKGYTKPTVGGDLNIWGTELNDSFELLDQNLSQNVSVDVSGAADVPLTSSQISNLAIFINGALTGNINLLFPPVGGFWILDNSCSGGHSVTAKVTGSSGATQDLTPSGDTLIFSDGTNIFPAMSQVSPVSGSPPSVLKFGNLIIQWGDVTITTGNSSATATFPVTFPTAGIAAFACATSGWPLGADFFSTSTLNVGTLGAGPPTMGGDTVCYWLVFGH